MPNGTLDGFNRALDFDEGINQVFRVSAILLLRQSFRDVASVRNLSISCCDQLLSVLVILSHSGVLLLIKFFVQQLRQLSNVRCNASRLILAEQLGRWSPPWLFLEIDIRQLLPAAVDYDKAGVSFFNGPGWREAALRH
jgi:hypothetical protein